VSRFQTRRPRVADPVYWLRHCTGYSVYSARERLGVVDRVVEVDGEPSLLIVRGDLLGPPRDVDTARVAEVVPREMRVLVH
jgi:hypothetical protein